MRGFLARNRWSFQHGDGDVIADSVVLLPDGGTEGVEHKNESKWGLKNGILVYYGADRQATTRFSEVNKVEGKLVLSGRLLVPGRQRVVIHVLKQH